MITIATYIVAIVKAIKQHKNPSPLLAVVRNIGYAEAAVSILTLQRSMLVSFGAMDKATIKLMNSLTGAAVCLFILSLGIVTIRAQRRTRLAQEKTPGAAFPSLNC